MSSTPAIADDLRAKIIAEPTVILDDPDLMRALVAANEKKLGGNIVDLRGIAMERLEERLDRLEDTHRSVIAAAYENIAGTDQIHRAVLHLLEPTDFAGFMARLSDDVAAILRVQSLRLVLETAESDAPSDDPLGEAVYLAPMGFVDTYAANARARRNRRVLLRQTGPETEVLYGTVPRPIRSEALLWLDLGEGRLPGMLALGSADPQQFAPNQGTDLLAFFGGVFERTIRRFLA